MKRNNQKSNIENNNVNEKGEEVMTGKIEQPTETNQVADGNSNNSTTENQLPEGVTVEPRNQEEMHMKYIMHSPPLVDVYLAVSDDNGYLLGDEKLEEDVKTFINEYKDKEIHEVDKPAIVLSQLRSLHRAYCERLERAENITDGIQTKSGIRRGMLLNIEKKLLRKKGKHWVVHYSQTYGKRSLRSAQDYMALARTSNIIPYSFLGKETLMECLRAIKALQIKGDDPMAALFDLYDIHFNPEDSRSKETLKDLKLGIACAVAITKIKKAEQKEKSELGIDPDYVKKLIDGGIAVNNDFIKDLFIIKNEKHNVIDHIKDLIREDGEGDELLPHIKKLIELPKIVAELKGTVESINQHMELAGRVKQDDISDLEQCILDLKNLAQVDTITDQ